MTLVSEILLQAHRESNIRAAGQALTTTQESEALARLNALVASVLGFEAGEQLRTWPVGSTGYEDSTDALDSSVWQYPRINSRLLCNLASAQTVYLPVNPCDGARIGVNDLQGNFATYNLTLNGNGRKIEGAQTLTLSTDSLAREWFYRADLGDWKRVTTLATSDEFPFPVEFDDMFIIMLAMRINPRMGRTLAQESLVMLDRSQGQFRARYQQTEDVGVDPSLLRMTGKWPLYNSERAFRTGYPW